MRRLLALLLLLGAGTPAAAAQPPPRHMLVIGDSLAIYNQPYLERRLPSWRIETDFDFARTVAETVDDLRRGAKHGLPRIIHVSSGTGDDPADPEGFQRQVRRVMRVAGPRRCVIWTNVWRLHLREPTFATLNLVLAQEDLARPNLRVVDWHAMVEAHLDWLIDLIHVNAAGNVARADAIAVQARACRRRLRGR